MPDIFRGAQQILPKPWMTAVTAVLEKPPVTVVQETPPERVASSRR